MTTHGDGSQQPYDNTRKTKELWAVMGAPKTLVKKRIDEVSQVIIYLQRFTYVFKHKSGQQNKLADAWSRRHALLFTLSNEVNSFDGLPTMYADDEDFAVIWEKCVNKEDAGEFHLLDGNHGMGCVFPRPLLEIICLMR